MSYASTILADSPVAYWKLAEASGTSAADATGNGNGGTYTGGVTLGQTGIISGDTSVLFNGSSGYVAPSLTFNSAHVTWEAWVYLTANPSNSGLICGCINGIGASIHDKEMGINSNGTLTWYVYDGGQQVLTTPSAISLNTWHYLACTADGTNMKINVDGTDVASQAAGNTYAGYTVPNAFINGNNASFYFFNFLAAKIGEVAIYNYALSGAQKTAHYNAAFSSGTLSLFRKANLALGAGGPFFSDPLGKLIDKGRKLVSMYRPLRLA